jgi:glutamate-1-semialdehyde aminotransferase
VSGTEAIVYQKINSYAQRIKTEIEALLLEKRITGHVSTCGSFIYLIHSGIENVTNVRNKMRENKELACLVAIGAICNGDYLTPAHSNNDLCCVFRCGHN